MKKWENNDNKINGMESKEELPPYGMEW